MVKIMKDPLCEWESMPTPTEAITLSSEIDETLDSQAPAEGVSTKKACLAPGHGGAGTAGVGSSSVQAEFESLAFELD